MPQYLAKMAGYLGSKCFDNQLVSWLSGYYCSDLIRFAGLDHGELIYSGSLITSRQLSNDIHPGVLAGYQISASISGHFGQLSKQVYFDIRPYWPAIEAAFI